MKKTVEFNTEVTKDPEFGTQLNGVIAELTQGLKKRRMEVAEQGSRLKRSPLGNMIDEGKLTPAFLLSEFPKVSNKQSSLPAAQREIVAAIIFNAAERTVLLKRERRAQAIADKANARAAEEEAAAEPNTQQP